MTGSTNAAAFISGVQRWRKVFGRNGGRDAVPTKANQSWLGLIFTFLAPSETTPISHSLVAKCKQEKECVFMWLLKELLSLNYSQSALSESRCLSEKTQNRALMVNEDIFKPSMTGIQGSPCCVTWLSVWWRCGRRGLGLWWQKRAACVQPLPSRSGHWTLWHGHPTGLERLIPHLLAEL